jgi:hypothetical protein
VAKVAEHATLTIVTAILSIVFHVYAALPPHRTVGPCANYRCWIRIGAANRHVQFETKERAGGWLAEELDASSAQWTFGSFVSEIHVAGFNAGK